MLSGSAAFCKTFYGWKYFLLKDHSIHKSDKSEIIVILMFGYFLQYTFEGWRKKIFCDLSVKMHSKHFKNNQKIYLSKI